MDLHSKADRWRPEFWQPREPMSFYFSTDHNSLVANSARVEIFGEGMHGAARHTPVEESFTHLLWELGSFSLGKLVPYHTSLTLYELGEKFFQERKERSSFIWSLIASYQMNLLQVGMSHQLTTEQVDFLVLLYLVDAGRERQAVRMVRPEANYPLLDGSDVRIHTVRVAR